MDKEVEEVEDDVVVDVDDGNGNDEMSTNQAEWKRRQSDIERDREREREKEMCVYTTKCSAHVYPDTVSVSVKPVSVYVPDI